MSENTKPKKPRPTLDEKIAKARSAYEDLLTQKAVQEGKTPIGKAIQKSVARGIRKRPSKLTKEKATTILVNNFVANEKPDIDQIGNCITALVEVCPEPTETTQKEQKPPEQVAN